MGKRLRWILHTYNTRPIQMLLAVVVLCGALVFLSGGSTRQYALYPEFPKPAFAIDWPDDLQKARLEHRQPDVGSLNLWAYEAQHVRRPAWFGPGAFEKSKRAELAEAIAEFPELRSLKIEMLGLPSDALSELAHAKKLESLSLQSEQDLNVAALQNVKSLKRLDFSNVKSITGIEILSELPRLETIVFTDAAPVTDNVLEALARLPNLKTVVLDFPESTYRNPQTGEVVFVPDFRITRSGIEALVHSTSLETLYAGGRPIAKSSFISEWARASAPKLTVRPAIVAKDEFHVMRGVIIGAVGAIIGLQLASQFRSRAVRVIPYFTAPHIFVAAVLFAIPFAIFVLVDWLRGVPLLSSFSYMLAMSAAAFALAAGFEYRGVFPRTSVRAAQQVTGVVAMCTFYLPIALSWLKIDYLLDARWMTIALCAAGGVSALNGIWLLINLSELDSPSTERNRRSPWAFQAQLRRDRQAARGDSQIEKLSKSKHHEDLFARIKHFRLGNPSLYHAYAMGLYLIVVMLAAGWFMRPGNGPLPALAIGALVMSALIISSQSAMAWRARVLVAQLEMLRPVSRKRFLQDFAASVGASAAPTIVLASTLIAIIASATTQWFISVGEFDTGASSIASLAAIHWEMLPFWLLGVAALLTFISSTFSALTVVVRRAWILLVIILPLAYAWMMGLIFVGQGLRNDRPLWSQPALFTGSALLAAAVLTSAGSLFWSWRRWQTFEFGRQA